MVVLITKSHKMTLTEQIQEIYLEEITRGYQAGVIIVPIHEPEAIETPCICSCGRGFDLKSGYATLNRASNELVCPSCHDLEGRVEDIQDKINELEGAVNSKRQIKEFKQQIKTLKNQHYDNSNE